MRKAVVAFAGLGLAALGVSIALAQTPAPNGEKLYDTRCKMCHEPAQDRAPGREQLGYKTQAELVTAMNTTMAPMSAGLSDADKVAIAAYLSPQTSASLQPPGAQAKTAPPPAGGRGAGRAPVVTTDTMCAVNPPIRESNSDWIGATGAAAGPRYQPNPGIRAADVSKLKVKWSFTLSQGNSQPTVVGDWLWIAGSGRLYAIDTKTGCVRWRVDGIASRTTPSPVKSSISPSGWALIVGQRNRVVKAFDAATGKELWASAELENHRVSGITGSPIVAGNQVFVPITSVEEATSGQASYACCSFRGSLVALDLATGKTQWKTFTITEPMLPIRKNSAGTQLQGPAGAAIWSAPTVDLKRGLVYVATGDSYTEAETVGADAIQAYEMKTGKLRWNNQVTEDDNFIMGCTGPNGAGPNCPTPLGPDFDFGASPILFKLPSGKEVVLSGQKSGIVYGMDPETGKLIWERQVGTGGALGGIEWGIGADTKYLFAPNTDIVALFDAYRRPRGAATTAAPQPPGKPGLTAVDPATGKVVWHVPTPNNECTYRPQAFPDACIASNSGAPAAMPGVVFAGSTDGWFHAYDVRDGKIVWRFNTTAQKYDTTNGIKGQPGGGMDGNGPTIAQGMVFATSGFDGASNYGSTGFGANVLLAFSVDGK